MILGYALYLAALLLATVAGVTSIAGLAVTYAGSFAAAVAIGSSIEIGKQVAVSFLFQYWNKINFLLKTVVTCLVLLVMMVTSVGVYGYLTKANQVDMVSLKQTIASLDLIVDEEKQLRTRKQQIDTQVAQLQPDDVRGRVRLNNQFKQETEHINTRLPEIAKLKAELSVSQVQQQADIGPMVFIAKTLGYDVDIATTWFTLLLVASVDPLAIILVICANVVLISKRREQEEANVKHINEQIVTPITPEPTVTPVVVETKASYEHLIDPAVTLTPVDQNYLVEEHDSVIDQVDSLVDQVVANAKNDVNADGEPDVTSNFTEWNQFFSKKIKTSSKEEIREKIQQLKQYAEDLNNKPVNLITEEDVILRNRILNFVAHHERYLLK